MDSELYTRWLQLGTFLPTMRTHMVHGVHGSKKKQGQPPRVENGWGHPEPFASAIEEAMRLRSRLVPYTYTAALEAFDSGVSIVHPLCVARPPPSLSPSVPPSLACLPPSLPRRSNRRQAH